MLKNYFKIALRNLLKNKIYSFINIFGLAVGLTCCILILLYVNNELSFDEFHSKSDRTYRAWTLEEYGEDDVYFNTITPLILGPTLEENIPEVEEVARRAQLNTEVKINDYADPITENIQIVDPGFFNIFDFKLLQGEKATALSQINSVLITQEIATKYFGSEIPLQKTLLIKMGDQYRAFTVTGIIEEVPSNSSIQYQLIIPFEASRFIYSENAYRNWFNVVAETFVLLEKNASLQSVEDKFPAMMQQALGEQNDEGEYTVGLQKLTDIHLNTEFPVGIISVSDPLYTYVLTAIAILVLLIACVNFITISISRSTTRAKEVGIRKTLGAIQNHLRIQFWGEALITTLISLVIALFLVIVLLPTFNSISPYNITLDFSIRNLLMVGSLTLLISLIAGVYPALFLSNFKPVDVLKGRYQIQGDKSILLRSMVIFQFTLSIFLIASTLIINNQLNFLKTKDLGFQKDHILVLQTADGPQPGSGFRGAMESALQKRNLLKSLLSSNSSIRDVSSSIFTPAQNGWAVVDYRDNNDRKFEFNVNFVDPRYLDMMDINILEGRSFSEDNTSDARRAIIVNQAFVDEYGIQNPIGSRLPGTSFEDHEIVGVTENFNYSSLKEEVEPLVLSIDPNLVMGGVDNMNFNSSPSPRISIRLSGENLSETLDQIEKAWSRIAPEDPFDFTFLDEAVDNKYRQEERLNKIVSFGSIFGILIACLGLFGLAALTTSRRTKEIGVRKVLGASSLEIVVLVIKDFAKLIVFSYAISIPLIIYFAYQWLQEFAYRIDIGVGVFIISGISVVIVAGLTISYQTVKAALLNPVSSLKQE